MGQRIGVIGLGQIGLPLAKLLLEAGHEVVGYRRGDMRELRQAGGQSADSPREIAESADIILSCLPSSAALDQVVDGQDGLLAARRPILLIELSTLPPAHRVAVRDRLARIGGEMLDCPVSGTPVMLAGRSSVLFASGDRSAFVRAEAVLRNITPKVFFLGEFGIGTRLKFCANLLVGVHIMAAAEAMSLGLAAGLDGKLLVSALRDSAATSLQFQVRAPMMVTGCLEQPLAPLKMLDKDLKLIESFAGDLGCATPLLRTTAEWYAKAMSAGLGERDAAAIIRTLNEACVAKAPPDVNEPSSLSSGKPNA
jgi:3-hydroxyisobutyrate dehydrogenase-like beta-hydroxyacid dehydrogenase